MVLIKVGMADSFVSGKMVGLKEGDKQILIANINGQFYAIGNVCTHRGCRISGGILEGENARCPCHGSVFSLKTGEVVHGPAKNPVSSYKIELRRDEIWVDV
jgi:nitrite reductase/ring-hydroxylating ferredoxin subunit